MKLLVLDGNSILNRAFYGIKLLTTKDGHFTNGIYGFLHILIRLKEDCAPDAVAIAFDRREPTFRHEMYDGYKAQRKGMPPELAQQLPILKELLTALGYRLVEQAGWEADDILGTLAHACAPEDTCCLATGDRDSLQLVRDNVEVLLAATKLGRPETVVYTPQRIREEYGIEPQQLIEVKALQGDASDNIPGVAGVGQKTALDLIQRFGSVEAIYRELDTLDVKPGVRDKLQKGKEMALLSRTLGTIRTDAPIDLTLSHYIPEPGDEAAAARMLARLEMFKLIEQLGLHGGQAPEAERPAQAAVEICEEMPLATLTDALRGEGRAYFLPQYGLDRTLCGAQFALEGKLVPVRSEQPGFLEWIGGLLADEQIEKYVDDSKPLYIAACRMGLPVRKVAFDAVLAGYLLNPASSGYALERLAQEYGVAPVEAAEEYRDAALFRPLCAKLVELIHENGQDELLHTIELPLAAVLASMQEDGFAIDAQGITNYGITLQRQIDTLVGQIYEQVGYEFNLNSPKQLGEALFVKLGLPAKKKTKSGYSTNAEVLESLAPEHPVVAMVLEYRTLSKLKSTYCDGLVKELGQDGRIHSTLNQTETRTGRISSTEPNLQNIPVRTELGRELRRYFRAKEGCVLVDADYSQIELRVLAHIADDPVMIEAFNENQDIHAITASQVFHMPLEMVTPLMRSRAKAVNFGIVYGIGAFSLAKDIHVSRAEADQYIKGYLSHYSGVRRYMEDVVAKAKENGYVETIFGRRRYLPELTASNAALRAFGERVARNMPIQGAAADIIKIAMIRVYQRLQTEGLAARLIMQVHDELIVEAPQDEAQRVAALLKEEMEGACRMKVILAADVHMGETWYDAKG